MLFGWILVSHPSSFAASHPAEHTSDERRVDFEKANEIFFRLGIIYKQQRKSAQSLEVRLLSRLVTVSQY